VSRSLFFPFMIALILHVLLARVELDFFKGPLRARDVPKALTVDLIKPMEVKEPSEIAKPAVIVKNAEKGMVKPSITKKLTPKPIPSIKRETTGVQRPLSEREVPLKTEAPAYLPSPKIPREKEEKRASKTEYAFVPDMVDIPTALQKREDVSHAGEEEQSALSSLAETITFATPNYKENTPPAYPLTARRRNYEGTVLLDVLVRRDGTVGSVRLSQSSGHEALDQSAMRAVMKWTFHPGKRGDEPLEMWVTIPIRYQLR
jgi:protein TonB